MERRAGIGRAFCEQGPACQGEPAPSHRPVIRARYTRARFRTGVEMTNAGQFYDASVFLNHIRKEMPPGDGRHALRDPPFFAGVALKPWHARTGWFVKK